MHLAFVTDSVHPHFAEDDKLLVQYLISQRCRVTPAIWDDQDLDWTAFDYIILRSPWDYFLKIEAFTAWLDRMDRGKYKIFNPISVIQWNKNKNYLLRFRDLEVPIPAFHFCNQGQTYDLKQILNTHQWEKAVIKPAVSGGAHKTWVTDHTLVASHQQEFDALILVQDIIIQKYSEEITLQGELSLIYFNKKFSHGVVKKAKEGEFRVQAQYGGRHQPYVPTDNLLFQIEPILSFIQEPLLYARIDGFLDDQYKFWLMELELLEPVLFFDSDPNAGPRFYHAILEMMNQ